MSPVAQALRLDGAPSCVERCCCAPDETHIEVTEMRKIKIEDVQRGDFIRRKPEAKTTFTAAGYCRYEQRYQLDDWDDISRCIYVKKGTEVFVGFDF